LFTGNVSTSNNLNINGNLYVSCLSVINGNCNINNQYVTRTNILNGIINNVSITSGNVMSITATSIFVSGLSYHDFITAKSIFGDKVTTGSLFVDTIYPSNNQNITLKAQVITIGDTNSIVNILGTTTYIAVNQLITQDKTLMLNTSESSGTAIDTGISSGIEINGTSGIGYLKSNTDASRLIFKAPIKDTPFSLLGTDMNDNLSLLSNLYVGGASYTRGPLYTLNNFYTSSISVFNNQVTTLNRLDTWGSLNVQNGLLCNSYFTMNSILNNIGTINSNGNINTYGPLITYGNSTTIGTLQLSGPTIVTGNVTQVGQLNIIGNVLATGFVNISCNSIFNGVVTTNNTLAINNGAIVYKDMTFVSSLYASAPATFIGNTHIVQTNNDALSGSPYNIQWTGYNTLFRRQELLFPSAYVQSIELSNSLYVYQEYTTNKPNVLHQMTMYVKLDNPNLISNLVISVKNKNTGWLGSIGRVYTNLNEISSSYNQISFCFIPPSSSFYLNFGYHQVPNIPQQEISTIRYYNLTITPIDGDCYIDGSTYISNNSYVYGDTYSFGRTLIQGSLLTYGPTVTNYDTSCMTNLYVKGNASIPSAFTNNLNSNIISSNSLNITNASTFYGPVSALSSFNVNNLNTNNIQVSTLQPLTNNTLNITGNVINIGSSNGVINMLGTTTYVATNHLQVSDKLITLNNNAGIDIGNNSGIEIYGSSGMGYIQTSTDGTRFIVKAPTGNFVGYLNTLDLNNNLYVSSTAYINNAIVTSLTLLGESTTVGTLQISKGPLYYIDNETYNIRWDNNINSNAPYTNLSSIIINNTSAYPQTINFNGSTNVYKSYTTTYPNKDHRFIMDVMCVNNLSSLTVYIIASGNTISKTFSVSDGLSIGNYSRISWIFKPPTTGSNFMLVLKGSGGLISYINLQIQAVTGNIIVDGSTYIQTNEWIDGDLNVKGSGNILNLNVSSSSNLNNLNVSGLSQFNNVVNIGSLITSGPTVIYGGISILNSLNISASTLINNVSISTANISSLSISNNNITGLTWFPVPITSTSIINSYGGIIVQGNGLTSVAPIYISGYSTINNTTINSSFVNNELCNNISVTSNLNTSISCNTILNGLVSCNSLLNISGGALSTSNVTLTSNFVANGTSVINGNLTINSVLINNMTTTGVTTMNSGLLTTGNVTIGSILNILSTCVLPLLPEYQTNAAAAAGGIPLWGLYRTGGILKIRLDDLSPTINLTGGNVTINQYSNYYDPGASATDNLDGNIVVYITSINSLATGELISNPIPLLSNNQLIPILNTNMATIYTIKYSAVDSFGNYTLTSRTVTIWSLIRSSIFFQQNITQCTLYGGRASRFSSNNMIGGFRNSWAISPSALLGIGYTFNSNYQFILKGRIVTNISPYIEISFDPDTTGWVNNLNGQNSGRYVIELGGTNAGSNNNGWVKYPDNTTQIFNTNSQLLNTLKAGFYLSLKYVNNIASIFIYDINKSLIFNWSIPQSFTYVNQQAPFAIYMDIDSCNFDKGILYDITPTLSGTIDNFNSIM
jgi:hypothetical protein